MRQSLIDELEIRWLIEKWVVWRDGGHWERFATLWHPEARMIATWFDGPVAEFIARSRAGYEAGVNVNHSLGGTAVDIAAERAVAETKMSISQRLMLHDELVDVVCHGRFYDFLDCREDGWKLCQRQCIYETDRVVPVTPRSIAFDHVCLRRFPEGYRHLAYAQELSGMTVNASLPGRRSSELDLLLDRGRAWLGR